MRNSAAIASSARGEPSVFKPSEKGIVMSKSSVRRKASGKRGSPSAWKPGESGNPLGRSRGPGRKLSDAFLADFFAAWTKRGRQAIDDVLAKYPDVAVYRAASQAASDANCLHSPKCPPPAFAASQLRQGTPEAPRA
jgi:hypothetical protein